VTRQDRGRLHRRWRIRVSIRSGIPRLPQGRKTRKTVFKWAWRGMTRLELRFVHFCAEAGVRRPPATVDFVCLVTGERLRAFCHHDASGGGSESCWSSGGGRQGGECAGGGGVGTVERVAVGLVVCHLRGRSSVGVFARCADG